MKPPTAPPSLWRSLLLLASLATALAVGAAASLPSARRLAGGGGRLPDEMTLADARSHPSPLLWLDARPASAFAQGAIPGAIPLNEDQWDEQIQAVLLRWQPGTRVIVYCDDTACGASRSVAERLRRACRLDDVWVLHGGWNSWRRAMAP